MIQILTHTHICLTRYPISFYESPTEGKKHNRLSFTNACNQNIIQMCFVYISYGIHPHSSVRVILRLVLLMHLSLRMFKSMSERVWMSSISIFIHELNHCMCQNETIRFSLSLFCLRPLTLPIGIRKCGSKSPHLQYECVSLMLWSHITSHPYP